MLLHISLLPTQGGLVLPLLVLCYLQMAELLGIPVDHPGLPLDAPVTSQIPLSFRDGPQISSIPPPSLDTLIKECGGGDDA